MTNHSYSPRTRRIIQEGKLTEAMTKEQLKQMLLSGNANDPQVQQMRQMFDQTFQEFQNQNAQARRGQEQAAVKANQQGIQQATDAVGKAAPQGIFTSGYATQAKAAQAAYKQMRQKGMSDAQIAADLVKKGADQSQWIPGNTQSQIDRTLYVMMQKANLIPSGDSTAALGNLLAVYRNPGRAGGDPKKIIPQIVDFMKKQKWTPEQAKQGLEAAKYTPQEIQTIMAAFGGQGNATAPAQSAKPAAPAAPAQQSGTSQGNQYMTPNDGTV